MPVHVQNPGEVGGHAQEADRATDTVSARRGALPALEFGARHVRLIGGIAHLGIELAQLKHDAENDGENIEVIEGLHG